MEFEVIEEKENIFFNRKELKINIKHSQSPTPSKSELVKELANRYSVPEDHVIIGYILTKKGKNEAVAKVKIYKERPKVKGRKEEKSEAQVSETK